MIFDDNSYKAMLPALTQAEDIIARILSDGIEKAGVPTLEIAHRIKDEGSAVEKIKRKPDNYNSIVELTDLIGFRIICYFSDDVDKLASAVEEMFIVDRENSVDKRQIISPTAFGYLSLHYICSLPESKEYPKELCNIKFEIQMRSSLQHTWAEIEHDLGYKSVFAIPREVRREFSRIAGLLELADESFVRIRKRLNDYTKQITEDIQNGRAENLSLDLVTLGTYMKRNAQIKELTEKIAALQGAEITEQSPESYLPKLEAMGISTLGQLEKMLDGQKDNAVMLAEELFTAAELDEIPSTASLHFLCRAELLYGEHSNDEIFAFFAAGSENKERAKKQAERLIAKKKHNGEKYENNK